MKILMVGSEMSPLAKTGGLGDVLGSLPQALAELGHDVRICLPGYSFIKKSAFAISNTNLAGEIKISDLSKKYVVLEYAESGSKSITYLIENDEYYGRGGLYGQPETGRDYEDNDVRFSFLCKAALDLVQKLHWQPDIIHAHDWQGALVSVYLKTTAGQNSFFGKTKSILTIHNMAYQGKFAKDRFPLLGLPEYFMSPMGHLEFFGQSNFLKGGILFSDKVTTVSETYAKEILGPQGCGLEGVLKSRAKDIGGILNGVDYRVWSPATDILIKNHYGLTNLSGKRMNKVELLGEAGLPVRPETPLVGIISRLVEQKGIQLVIEAAPEIFEMNLQMIVLGSGEKKFENELKSLETKYPGKLKVHFKFDEALAHKIEASADMFLMPSLFEPCGLNQMYSLRYGTPPIVHKVGGLADTVVDYKSVTQEGTGFVFEKFSADSMVSAIKRAVELFSKKRRWMKLMKNGMKQDFSWNKSAAQYVELYKSLLSK